MILGAPIGTAIAQQFGWRATFLAIGIFAAIALAFLVRWVPVRGVTASGSVIGELRVLRSRGFQLALAITAVGNAGVLMVFVYLAPLLTDVSGFAAGTVPALILAYGVGAALGNLAGGWLSDRDLMGSLVGLLVALSIVLALFWRLETLQTPTAILVFLTGALAFSIIPGMQTRVLVTAKDAPTLGIALNASGFQIAAAFSAWLGGQIIGSELGLDFVPLAGALVTAAGGLLAFGCWMRERPSTGQFLSQRCG